MKRKNPFFSSLVVFLLVGIVAIVSLYVKSVPYQDKETGSKAVLLGQEIARLELLEALDKLVSLEHYYFSVYGRYTYHLSRLGASFSERVFKQYEVRVLVANAHHFLAYAFSERNGLIEDSITIDETFRVHANFILPKGRTEFLRSEFDVGSPKNCFSCWHQRACN
jgi:cytochrome c biogenesis factor